MIAKNELFATTLRKHGHSVTSSRKEVFLALEHHEPLSMHKLVEQCPHIDRASVYRSIALFEEIGITKRIYSGWKYKIELSDMFGHHHHHATGVRCGHLYSLDEEPAIESALKAIAARHSFVLTAHEVELSVICKACQAKFPEV